MPFLNNFMTWNEGTEVPENYYFWSGISALSSMVNGQVWINMGRFRIFPNMYIVLLGPPANGKTSALRRAEYIVRSVGDITLSAQSETAEGLVRFMRDKCVKQLDLPSGTVPFTPISLYLSELSNFLGKDPAGMIDLLTGIWDCGGDEFHRRTKGQGEDMLPRPNVNLIAGTTQDWITTYLKTDIVGGGFTRRVIFVPEPMGDDTKRVPWPEDTPDMLRARDNCISYGLVLRQMKGEFKYAPGARHFYETWYNTRPIPREPDIRGYHKSKPALVLKTSMLVALSEKPELVVTKEHIETALTLLAATEGNLNRVFQAIGRNELNSIAMRVLDMLNNSNEMAYVDSRDGKKKKARACAKKWIMGQIYKEAKTLDQDDIFNHLLRVDKIEFFIHHRPNNPPVEYVILKDSIGLVPEGDSTEGQK